MELEEFIKKSLINISNGVKFTNKEILGEGHGKDRVPFMIEPSSWNREKAGDKGFISFDIAVTASKEVEKSGGGGIRIHVVSLGGEKGDKVAESSISRIKFYIAVNYTIA